MAVVSLEAAPALEVFYEHGEDPLPLQHNILWTTTQSPGAGTQCQEFHLTWNLVKGKTLT